MDSRSQNDTEAGPLLLREEELSDIDSDRFGHSAYIDTLEQVVHDAGPKWHIGLFGTWGSGKSSIINLLYKRIEKSNSTVRDGNSNTPRYDFSNTITVSINAWEHSGEAIQTSLLLDLNRELDRKIGADSGLEEEQFGLLNSEEIMQELYDVEEREDVDSRPFREWAQTVDLTVLKRWALLAAVFGIAAFLFVQFTPVSSIDLLLLLLGGGALTFFGEQAYTRMEDERKSVQRTMINPRNEWAGAYGEIYDRILTKAEEKFENSPSHRGKLEHIVITIDDLDRCESESVYETLIALKSFMEHDLCTYIIPCDEEALYRHVQAADTGQYLNRRENQQNFLAKFFETRIRIPELKADGLTKFALEKNNELARPLSKRVIHEVLMESSPSTPRRIIQALNRITTYRILAESRDTFDAIDTDREEDLMFLAKISILQEDYPTFFAALERNELALESIYAEWESGLGGTGRSDVSSLLNSVGVPADQQDRLIDFLIATQSIDQDPEPYLRLSGSELSNSERFENALKQRRVSDLEQMTAKATESQAEQYVDVLIKTLTDDEARYDAFRSSLQILEAFEINDHRGAIAQALYTVLDDEDHTALLADVDLNLLRPCIERLQDAEQIQLLEWYVDAAVSATLIDNENLQSLLNTAQEELELLYEVRTTFAENMTAALSAGTISKPKYDEIVDDICRQCPQLYSQRLIEGGEI